MYLYVHMNCKQQGSVHQYNMVFNTQTYFHTKIICKMQNIISNYVCWPMLNDKGVVFSKILSLLIQLCCLSDYYSHRINLDVFIMQRKESSLCFRKCVMICMFWSSTAQWALTGALWVATEWWPHKAGRILCVEHYYSVNQIWLI